MVDLKFSDDPNDPRNDAAKREAYNARRNAETKRRLSRKPRAPKMYIGEVVKMNEQAEYGD